MITGIILIVVGVFIIAIGSMVGIQHGLRLAVQLLGGLLALIGVIVLVLALVPATETETDLSLPASWSISVD